MPTGVYTRTSNMKTGLHMKGRTAWNKDKIGIYSEETLKSIRGENNHGWKDGISLGENRKFYFKNYSKNYKDKLRNNILVSLGNKCIKCGFTDRRALQIDHINGGGNRERIEYGIGRSYNLLILKSVEEKENKFQLLCANCNWIKRYENNEDKRKID